MAEIDPTVADERFLIEQARKGNPSAFTQLVRAYEERAIRIAYSFVGNFEDARDIAQEGFVKAYGSLKHFKGDSKFSTWLYRILANLCKDFLRKKKVRRHTGVQVSNEGDGPTPIDKAESKEGSPRQHLKDQELEGAIRSACEALPEQQKNVFILRYLDGLSLEEIAQALKLSTGAVKAHLWQACQKMRKMLAPYQSEGGE